MALFRRLSARGPITIGLAVIISVFLVVSVAEAVSTISTNISTEGTLRVDGNSTLGDAVADAITANGYFTQVRIGTGATFGKIGTVGADELGVEGDVEVDGTAWFDGVLQATSTLLVGGALTTYANATFGDATTDVNLFTGTLQASTTALFTSGLTTYGNSTFGDAAADTNIFTGTLQASTTALFTSGLTTYGNSTFGDATTDTNIFTGTLQASTTALFTSGLTTYANSTLSGFITSASSTAVSTLRVADALYASSTLVVTGTTTARAGLIVGTGGSGVTQLLFGTCSVDLPSMAASSTGVANCTATGVSVSDQVWVTPNNLPNQIVFTGASSTAADTIQVAAYNIGSPSGTIDPAAFSWAWMAVR